MRKGILDPLMYENSEQELLLGYLSALTSSAIWLLVATFFKLPISGTHSIVGSTIGFSLVARGTQGLHWKTLFTISMFIYSLKKNRSSNKFFFFLFPLLVGSWFASPVLSGLTSLIIYWIIQQCILKRKDPVRAGLISLPIFYGFTVVVNVFSIVHDGPKLLYMENMPLWLVFAICGGVGVVTVLLVQFVVVPWQRKKLMDIPAENNVNFNIGESSGR